MVGARITASAGTGGSHPLWHYAIVAGAAVSVYAGLRVSDWWRGRSASQVAGPLRRLLAFRLRRAPASGADFALAACSATSGMIHLDVCPAHFREAVVFGVFFVVAAGLQVVWAALVWNGPSRRLLWWGALGNAAVVALWTATRTVGLPIGPAPWRPEAFGMADVAASLLEVAIVVCALRLVLRSRQGSRSALSAA